MMILVSPDSFKDCMSAEEAASAIEEGILKAGKNIEIIKIPLADVGEGTARTITKAAGGIFIKTSVHDPLGRKIEAEFGLIDNGKIAVLDMASASGLELLKSGERNPMKTSSRGTGELIKAALDHGAENILLGIGGSAVNDGGIGMLSAIGFRFFDEAGTQAGEGGQALEKISGMDSSGADIRLKNISINAACDVNNPLTGENGASAVFGPQKGADPEMVKILDKGLKNLGSVWIKDGLTDNTDHPGDGAAGGLGAALRICLGAKMESGAKLVMKYSGFLDAIPKADLVITGEGKTDSQSKGGKLCFAVSSECKKNNVPAALLSGALEGKAEDFFPFFDYAVSISNGETSLDNLLKNGRKNLSFAAENLLNVLLLGEKQRQKKSSFK